MTPGDLLAAARRLLAEPGAGPAGVWPRACAMLIRQALEAGVDAIWLADPSTEGLMRSSMRSQLTCLPMYLDARMAREVSYVWAVLSEACHYHAYELAPTAVELSDWIATVDRLLASLPGCAAGPPVRGAGRPRTGGRY